MNRAFVPLLSISALLCFSFHAAGYAGYIATPQANAPPASDSDQAMPGNPAEMSADWPLTFNNGGTTYSIFEPQCDSWNGHNFVGRSAVAVQIPGQSQPVYGTIGLGAITLVDKNATR